MSDQNAPTGSNHDSRVHGPVMKTENAATVHLDDVIRSAMAGITPWLDQVEATGAGIIFFDDTPEEKQVIIASASEQCLTEKTVEKKRMLIVRVVLFELMRGGHGILIRDRPDCQCGAPPGCCFSVFEVIPKRADLVPERFN